MSEDKKPAKISPLENALSIIEKQFGKGSIMCLGAKKSVSTDVISSGSISIDMAMGIGGFPKGRIIEIYGPESSGKTTIALQTIASCQKKKGVAAFIDAEHALDPAYAKNLGVDVKNLLVSQPDNGEEALEILDTLVRSNAVDIIVVDSVAALTPKAEIEGSMGDHHIGAQARLMSQALRKLTAHVHKSNCIIIFINQLRMKIGVFFGNPEVTSGGNALKFYSSIRLDVRKSSLIKDGTNAIGHILKVKVVKNKLSPPFQESECELIYGKGVHYAREVFSLGLLNELITKAGSYYSYKEESIGRGKDDAVLFLENNPKVAEAIHKEILVKNTEA